MEEYKKSIAQIRQENDVIDYLFLAGFGLTPIEEMPDDIMETKEFWLEDAKDRYCIIEQVLAETLIEAMSV